MTPAPSRILVWDLAVRAFHWLLALCFLGAYFTAEEDQLRLIHITLGYTVAGLIVFRLLWGLGGSRYARFGQFVRGPGAAWRYLRGLAGGRPEHHVGHNPAGALAILALLALGLAVPLTGLLHYLRIGGRPVGETHEVLGNVMLGLVIVHVLAVLVSSWLHRENLIGAMLHGHKPGRSEDGITRAHALAAAVVVLLVLLFWSWQWSAAPLDGVTGKAPPEHHHRPAALNKSD